MSMKPAAVLCIALAQAFAVSTPLVAGFDKRGGWVIDQQFLDVMGSPYLLAHGLGTPVESARTQYTFAEGGTYHVWVRAKDWVPSHHPGRFKVLINGKALPVEFGANGEDWNWQQCGSVAIDKGPVTIELKDLTGFDGRCDAIFFTTDAQNTPPAQPNEKMQAWRRKLLGLPEKPVDAGKFDVIVVGGGIAGCASALAAVWPWSRTAPYWAATPAPRSGFVRWVISAIGTPSLRNWSSENATATSWPGTCWRRSRPCRSSWTIMPTVS